MSKPLWLGKDVFGGVPSEARPDRRSPSNWSLAAIFATPRPHHLAASPDGSAVAFVLDLEGTSDIWAIEPASRNLTRLTTDRGLVAYWEDSAPSWSPDASRLAYNSDGKVWMVSARGGLPRRVVPGSTGTWVDDQRMVVIVERDRCSRLALVIVDDPWPAPFGPKDGDVGRPRVTGDGRILATFWPKDDLSRSDIILLDLDGGWSTLAGHPDRRAANHAERDGRVAFTLEDEGRAGVFLVDLDGGEQTKVAGGDTDYSDLHWEGDGESLLAVATSRGHSDLVRIELDGTVRTIAEGGTWDSPVPAGPAIVAVHEAFNSPASLIAIDQSGNAETVFDGTPAPVRAAAYAKNERITFESTDGLEIEGFLFRPADVTAPVPAVVYPHGGPTSHYGDEWDGHAQYFVDKGYCWLAINFRGSTSYGLGFERANHGQWGVGDVEDCIAAAAYLAGLEWVDSSRIAIFGASYGAYLALASLVHEDNPFACGVVKYGDSDILTSWAQSDREGADDLERMMGHPSQNRRAYRTGSPIHQIRRINRPVLIAHGELDARVHPKQSEELVEALDQLGATYEYFTYPTEGHGLLRREPQLHFYRRLERFFDWYLM